MSEIETGRMYFKDDWHCSNPPNFDCGCWQKIDVERDKKFLAWCFRGRNEKHANVTYSEYKANPEMEGKTSRDRNIYHVDTKTELLSSHALDEAAWHGFRLSWIAAYGKDHISLAFEHNGVWVEEQTA